MSEPLFRSSDAAVRADVLAALEGFSSRGRRAPQEELVWLELAGPNIEPRAVLGLAEALQSPTEHRRRPLIAWESGEECWVGIGSAAELTASGAGRFEAVRSRAEEFAVHCEQPQVLPRWFGGFSFEADLDSDAWRDFGDAWFVLPQIVAVRGARAPAASGVGVEGSACTRWFVMLTSDEVQTPPSSATLQMISALWDAAGERPPLRRLQPPSEPRASAAIQRLIQRGDLRRDGGDAFDGRIEEVVEMIGRGQAIKIVAADGMDLDLSASPDLEQILEGWAREAGESTRFVLARGDSVFLGATPERLVRLRGSAIDSMALAGTQPKNGAWDVSPGTLADRLLESPKEQHEHALVVEHLRARLAKVCATIDGAAEPSVLELHDMLHLQTTLRGRTRSDHHVLDLVADLHPTPAVCGLPVEVAARWIRDREKNARGWYSGPVGWFDAGGDGDFHVALRSMLLTANHNSGADARARLFAGVGLVSGSEIAAEQTEIATKLLTAGRALSAWIEGAALESDGGA